jgi:hypothetical protein
VREELDARHDVERVRLEVGAMGAAIEEWGAQKETHAVVAVRGTEQPGNAYSRELLLEAFMEGACLFGPNESNFVQCRISNHHEW